MSRVRGRDLMEQIPEAQGTALESVVKFAQDLHEKAKLNIAEALAFDQVVRRRRRKNRRSANRERRDGRTGFRKLLDTLESTRHGIGSCEAVFFLRGFIRQVAALLEHLKHSTNLTVEILEKLVESGAEINWIFEIYERSCDLDGVTLGESTIPNLLQVLCLFVIPESGEIGVSIQNQRSEIIYLILKKLRSPPLQLCVFRHLLCHTMGYWGRISVCQSSPVGADSMTISTFFAFLFLLESHLMDMDVITEVDLANLKRFEFLTISGLPILPASATLVAKFLCRRGESIWQNLDSQVPPPGLNNLRVSNV